MDPISQKTAEKKAKRLFQEKVSDSIKEDSKLSKDEIEDLIERQPERAVALKQADEEFKNRIKEMEIDLESFKTEVEDRKDARENFATDWTPKVFSVLTLLLYGGFVMIVTLMPHDQNDETIISLVLA